MARTITRYPPRLSMDELRSELDNYIASRTPDHSSETLSLDRRKVEYFLTWLEQKLKESEVLHAALGRRSAQAATHG